MSPPGPTGGPDLAATDRAIYPAADLDRRFTAFVVDRVIGWGIAAGFGYVAWRWVHPDDPWMVVLVTVGAAALAGLVLGVVVGTTGLTPGKALAGLRVVRRSTGRPIGVLAALGRQIVLGVAGLPTAGLGLATLAWTAAMDPSGQRRALHDRIGDAIVVDVRPREMATVVEDVRPQQIVNLTAMRLLPSPAPEPSPFSATSSSVPVPTDVSPTPTPTPTPAPAPVPPRTPDPAPTPAEKAAPPPARAPAPAAPTAPASERTQLRPPASHGDQPAPAVTTRWSVAFDTGETFVVEGLAIVGRRPEPRPGEVVRHVVPLPSSDMSLSKTHAQFQVAPDGALVVMDRGSTNGSYVVRKGLSKALSPGRPSTLVDGDLVRFGDRSMRVTKV